ncbi:hypothetical protein M9H77_23228 [Catharanthus roseus]|uniref:Uncharacterized protein n=1 Tax=Catharanthus roseus TaxID=4058 RepID=A0ACC0AUE8_CATRO|nr:hypothetical protein M9H77_23228 [Catharanthus roseus]
MELSIVEEAPKIKELAQAKIEESLEIHAMDETSKEEPCCIMNEKSMKIKEKERLSCNEQKFSNVINSLNTLFEHTIGFKFYHLNFKDFLLKDFQNHMETNLELLKVNTLVFENFNLRKEAFEQIFKDFGDKHLYYHIPFKNRFSKLFILFVSFKKDSCALTLKL